MSEMMRAAARDRWYNRRASVLFSGIRSSFVPLSTSSGFALASSARGSLRCFVFFLRLLAGLDPARAGIEVVVVLRLSDSNSTPASVFGESELEYVSS